MPVAALGSSRAPATHVPPSWRNVKTLAIVSCPIASPIVAMSAQRSEVIIASPPFRAKVYDGGRLSPIAIASSAESRRESKMAARPQHAKPKESGRLNALSP
jgi:hypothetical protein